MKNKIFGLVLVFMLIATMCFGAKWDQVLEEIRIAEYIVYDKTAAAINTAITAANTAGGGRVILSSGEYDLTGDTAITMLDNVTLIGYGATLKGDGGLAQIIYAVTLNNAGIYGVEIDGDYSTSGSGGENGILIGTGTNIIIKDCYIHNMEARGVAIGTLTEASFINNRICLVYMGIRVGTAGSQLRFIGNHIEDFWAGGITLSPAYDKAMNDIVIADNFLDSSATSEIPIAQPIVCYAATSGATAGTIERASITGNTMIGNNISGDALGGIRWGGSDAVISGNSISDFYSGIFLLKTNANAYQHTHFCRNVSITGNTINVNTYGIYATVVDNLTISGNTIRISTSDNVDLGITIGYSYSAVTHPNTNIVITNNTIKNISGLELGIYCNNTNQLTITGNIARTLINDGIRLRDCYLVNCQNNVMCETGDGGVGYGVRLLGTGADSSDYIVVANNQLNGTYDGAVLNSSSGGHIKIYNNHGNADYHAVGSYTDSEHLYLGSDNDLDIFHSGSHGFIKNNTGNFHIYANATEYGMIMVPNAQVDLYYNGIKQWATTSDGTRNYGPIDMTTHKITGLVDPTANQEAATKKYVDDNSGLDNIVEDNSPQLGGNLDCLSRDITNIDDIYMSDSDKIWFGTSNDMYVDYYGTLNYLRIVDSDDHKIAYFYKGGAAVLCYDGVAKAATNAEGFNVVGEMAADGDIWCTGDIYVTGGGGCCADYVFEEGYNLMPLDELQKFIDSEKCLPDMTINDTDKVDLITSVTELLVKVEEQALYILQLHERVKTLEEGTLRIERIEINEIVIN